MEQLEPYYRRSGKRFLKDATPWARDNILWGIVVLVAPPLAIYLRDRHAEIDWGLIKATLWLYGFALGIYALVHVCRVPKKLDDDRATREHELLTNVAELKRTIQKETEKAKRTPAEQHDYDTAKKALLLLKEKGLIALRHIRKHGSLTFGTYNPVLPPGLNANDTLWVYNHCASEGLLTCNEKLGSGEKTFAVSPRMTKILDEVLYENDSSSTAR